MLRGIFLSAFLLSAAVWASADQIVIDAISGEAENTGGGWVVETGSGPLSIGVSRFTSVKRRGLMEYSLAGLPDTADVLSASITLSIFFLNNPPLPNLQLNGYVGDGSLAPADAEVPFNELGRTGTFSTTGAKTVDLDPNYIESLLSNGDDWLGIMVYQLSENGSAGFTGGQGLPRLTIEYVPEPAALASLALAVALLRRR